MLKKIKSYIKDTNDFLRKLDAIPSLPEDIILCTIDVVGLYPNIPHEDGLVAMREALDTREDKSFNRLSYWISGMRFAKNILEHNTSFYKQLRVTAIGAKMAPPYAIIFMGELEEKLLKDCDKRNLSYGGDI